MLRTSTRGSKQCGGPTPVYLSSPLTPCPLPQIPPDGLDEHLPHLGVAGGTRIAAGGRIVDCHGGEHVQIGFLDAEIGERVWDADLLPQR